MIFLKKTGTAPSCLEIEKAKASGSYNCNGVLNLLKEDFKNKCYICEYKEPTTINTEHFIPHKGDIQLKFDWNNLFYSCGHCNNIKLAKTAYDNILNCTIEDDKVETNIKYWMNPFPKDKVEITAQVDEEKVNNTVKLLLEVYNGTTILKNIEASNIRSKLLKEIVDFQNLLIDYYEEDDVEERKNYRNKIRKHLSISSDFTAFKRWIIRSNDERKIEFNEFLQ